ncbi:putative redox protein, regulator of disulfide bond formation [gamma proteobacterium HIMB55]|nr:putative redox protein, regulator of disulfide bond formation [gamma proteobacterium HIMB55]
MSDVQTIDARGKRCPMPVLMAKRAINEGALSDSLEIWVTDPSAPKDFETFARLEGHTVSWEQRGEMVAITLRLSSSAPGENP